MAANEMLITVHPRKFEIAPPCSEVRAGFETLYVVTNWDDNQDTWLSLTVRDIERPDGSKVSTNPPSLSFVPSENRMVKQMHFSQAVNESVDCKCAVDYVLKADPTKIYTVDPTIRLRP